MAFYSELADADKVTGTAIVTSGIWQDGVSNITTFFPIFVSLEKKTVSGAIIFTPFCINFFLKLSCKFFCFIY